MSSNKMRHSGLLKTHLKEYFFLGMNIRCSERIPKIPIAAVNIDEVIISEQFPCAKILNNFTARIKWKCYTVESLAPKNEQVFKQFWWNKFVAMI